MQIDYSAIGVFLNASLTPLPWWPKKPGLIFEPALKPRAGLEDRAHPKWWAAQSSLLICLSLLWQSTMSVYSACSDCNDLLYKPETESPVLAWRPKPRLSWFTGCLASACQSLACVAEGGSQTRQRWSCRALRGWRRL